jgi:hypothetical protein
MLRRDQTTYVQGITMRAFFRHLSCVLLLTMGPSCAAQTVTVRLVNAENGRPLQKWAVSVSIPYDKTYDKLIPAKYNAILNLETDSNGEAHFKFPEPPPAHFAVQVRVDWSRWDCACGVLGSTDELLREGIVGSVETGHAKKSANRLKPVPGEVLFAARPLSFFERLLYPLLKE